MDRVLLWASAACALAGAATGSGVWWAWASLAFLLSALAAAARRILGGGDEAALLAHAGALALAVVPAFLGSPWLLLAACALLSLALRSERARPPQRRALAALALLLVVALALGRHALGSFTPIDASSAGEPSCHPSDAPSRPCGPEDLGRVRVSSWMTFYHPDGIYYLGIASQMAATGSKAYTHPQFGGEAILYPPGYFAFYAAFARLGVPLSDVARALPPALAFLVLASLLHCFTSFTGRADQGLMAALLALCTFVTPRVLSDLAGPYPYLHWFKGTPLGVEASFMTPQQAGLLLVPLCCVLFQRTFRDRTGASAVLLGIYAGTLLNHHVLSALLLAVALAPSALHKAWRGLPLRGLALACLVAALVAGDYLARVLPSSAGFLVHRWWYSKDPLDYLKQFGLGGALALAGLPLWWGRRRSLEGQARLRPDGSVVPPPPSGGCFLLWAAGSLVFLNAFALANTHDIDRVMTLLCVPVGFFASFPLAAWSDDPRHPWRWAVLLAPAALVLACALSPGGDAPAEFGPLAPSLLLAALALALGEELLSRRLGTARWAVPLLLIANSLTLLKIANALATLHAAHPPVAEACAVLDARTPPGATVLVADPEGREGDDLLPALCGRPSFVGNPHLARTWGLPWESRMDLYRRALAEPSQVCATMHSLGVRAFALPPAMWPRQGMEVWHRGRDYVVGDCVEPVAG